ncbi:hypothetical protein [Clostridium sp. OS1-26]|uniref:hypothetical protein n=1 Tax=Clostridium sp. OS1-26 TaxID=3070681 RepID=UPI0027DF6A34|nr:hypothetical protein [Clostridium sp. OS1-26]WML34785.1 hypothetical protein RCG18_26615 [Clostridium sp. OS1-26]
MKSLKKLVLIGAVVAMSTSLFTGCSNEGKALSDAFSKTQKITSAETKTEMGLRFTAENLSAEEQNEVSKVIPMINSSKMAINTKVNQNEDGKVAKMQADVAMQLGTMPLDMGIWADVNMANGKNEFKEIIKVPAAQAQKMGGKQYVILDSSKMGKTNGTNVDLTKASEDMQKKFSQMILGSMASFDPGFKIVTDTGYTYMALPDGRKLVHTYEVKLDDKKFKDLIKYTSNNLINNKEAKGLLKDYLTTVTKTSAASEEEAKANQAGIDKAFSDFDKGLPEFTSQMNKVLNSFDGVTLIGDKGIVIDYAVDSNGYIVNEKGNIDLVFDSAKFIPVVQSLSGTSTTNKLTGVYKLGIDFNTSTFNINKNLEIKFPETNSENSVQFQDLISGSKIK